MENCECALLTLVNTRGAEARALPEGWLSSYRTDKIARLKNERDRALSVCAELALILCLISRNTGFTPPARYGADARGKLSFDSPDMGCFSISHSGDFAACAHAYIPIGVDIERRDRAFDKLERRMLSPDEMLIPPNERTPANIWCAKESYLKLMGEGLAGGMENLTVNGARVFDARSMREAALAYYDIDNYACAVCAYEKITIDARVYTYNDALELIHKSIRGEA